ncbi:MAG: hypothetical protein CMN86_01915 [Stappia sp.]|nr:hypothetical protein [Stappia sp.]
MKSRPILHPPIQVSHLYYRLTRILVWGGITRYYSISGLDDFDALPAPGTPTIFIGNHQNGMMDPMPFCGFVPQQIHWLTRADVFWNPVARHILFGYNQMPVYRQRDRVDQLRERNDVIFDACVDRMHAGAAMGIFPEGNHNPFPSLRALKGGLAEMLARAARRHPELKSIQVVPIGLDYEHYLDWRRRFRVRAGQAIPFADLLQEDGTIDKPALNARVREAFKRIMVDLQPEDAQPNLHPALRAHRTTEMTQEAWKPFTAQLAAWAKRWTEDEGWSQRVKDTHAQWHEAWIEAGSPGRPEAWGTSAEDIRKSKPWAAWLHPLAMLANLPTYPAQWFVTRYVDKTIKNREFVPTVRLGLGIVLFPVWWFLLSIVAGLIAPAEWGWLTAGLVWFWGQAGSRLLAWSTTQQHDRADTSDGRAFWHDAGLAKVRDAWKAYLEAVNN